MKKIAVTIAAAIAGASLWTSTASAEEIVVQKGDNLWSIARSHETTVDHLMKLNNLQSSIVYPGQKLQTDFSHTVKKGETLWGLARHYGCTVDELKKANHLTSDKILINQVLIIPDVDAAHASGSNSSSVNQSGVQTAATDNTKEVSNNSTEQSAVKPDTTSEQAVPQEETVASTKAQTTSAQTTQTAKTQTAPVQTTQTVKTTAKPATTQQQAKSGKTITVTSTGYTVQSAGGSGITATGINLKKNPNAKVIAVDPKVIPLGSKVYVEGYGEAIAGDTGGAIKGKKIDIYFPTKGQAMNWGVRTVNVTILGK